MVGRQPSRRRQSAATRRPPARLQPRAVAAGIFNADTLTVDDWALIGNTASTYRGTDLNVPFPINAGFGGGLDNESSATVENTTISGNTAGYSGSGLSEGGGIFSESLTMLFSTVTNNAAVSPHARWRRPCDRVRVRPSCCHGGLHLPEERGG